MNKIIITTVILILLGIGAFTYKQQRGTSDSSYKLSESVTTIPSETTTTETQTASTTEGNPAPAQPKLTAEEVAKHNSKASCYSIINSSVYDLTSWISKHPGGEKGILSICGKDGTSAFMGKHGGGQKQIDQLSTFKIGALVQ